MNMHQAASQVGLASGCSLGSSQLYMCSGWSPGFRNKTLFSGQVEGAQESELKYVKTTCIKVLRVVHSMD